MKKGRIIAAVVALLVIAGVGGCLVLGAQAAIPVVTLGTAERGELARAVTVSGSTATGENADVFPPTAGTLAEVYVADGDRVEAGDKLALMDTEQLELQVASAQAAYQAALAQLAGVQAQTPSQSDRDAVDAGAAVAFDAYEDAQDAAAELWGVVRGLRKAGISEYTDLSSIVSTDPVVVEALSGFQELVAKGVVPVATGATIALLDTQADGLGLAADQAYVAYLQAQAQADALDVDNSSSMASARSAVDQAALSLSLAHQTLADATLTAPIDGIVVFNTTPDLTGATSAGPGPGSSVSPAAAPFTIVRLGFLEFVCDVDEADVDALEAGMGSTVVLDAFPGQEFTTEVRRVGVVSQLTATGGNAFPVYMDLAETGQDILVGMRGSADIEVDLLEDVVSVPIEALFDEEGSTFVYLLDDEELVRQEVEVGIYTVTRVQILSGLDGDEEVVLSSATELDDGLRVRVGDDEGGSSGPTGPFGGGG